MATPYDFMQRESSQPGYGGGAQAQQNNYAMPQSGVRVGGQSQNNPNMLNPATNPYGMSTSMGGGAQPQTGGFRGTATTRNGAAGAGTFSLYGGNQQYAQRSGTPGQGAQPASQGQSQQQQYQTGGVPSYGGNGQTSPNPDPYGSPWVDYMNADGSPHINYQYGQNSGGGGGQPGPTGPNGGSNTYWQNPSAGQQPGRDPRYPNDRGPMQYPQQQGAQQQGGNGLPFTWDQYSQARNDNPRIAQEWAQMNLPYAQLQQNTTQYNQDFTEAQRRYDQQFLQSQGQQAYDQMMQTRQQHMAEQAQQTATNQWDQQFGWTQQNDRFNQNMATNQFDREGSQWNQQFAQAGNQWNQQFGLAQNQQNFQQGMDTRGMDLQYMQNQQQYGLDTRGMNLQELSNSQQYGLSQNQQAMQAQQMAHSMGIDTRGMNLQELQQATQAAYQQQQLGQQATLTREQLASQERMAVMQATGRQAAPTARWVRSW